MATWALVLLAVVCLVNAGLRDAAGDGQAFLPLDVDPPDAPRILPESEKPFFDLVSLIYSTASEEDKERLQAARSSWLSEKTIGGLSFKYVVLICADDSGAFRLLGEPDVAIIPCKHGYTSLVTKGIEGYRYIASNYRFDYVLKTDMDTVVPLSCIVKSIKEVDRKKCPSFGIGRWYAGGDSKVWTIGDVPYGPKYHNEPYKADTGNNFYNPYASGWANVWSADVARFLGMFGRSDAQTPEWRRTWMIDDAAIGTFIIGLDICRVGLACQTPSGISAAEVALQNRAIADDKSSLPVLAGEKIEGFEGPFKDDVPGIGDLMNIHAPNIGNCAHRCQMLKGCQSFEFSPSVQESEDIKNCQIATGSSFGGKQFADYVAYLKVGVANVGAMAGVAMVPISGFRGPYADDVPGIGDIANVQVNDLDSCAARCRAEPTCKSIEFSRSVTAEAAVKNCQLATGDKRSGFQYLDFVLYIRDAAEGGAAGAASPR